jgi:hypothetical protein
VKLHSTCEVSAEAQIPYRGHFLPLSGKTEKGCFSVDPLGAPLTHFDAALRQFLQTNGSQKVLTRGTLDARVRLVAGDFTRRFRARPGALRTVRITSTC